MPSFRRLSALTVALVLALGTSARAQSAGDDQYVDPFAKRPSKSEGKQGQGSQGAGGQGQSQGQGSSTPPSPSTGTPSTTTPVAPATGTAATGAPATGTAAAGTAAGQGQLARTGVAPGWLGLAGGALLLGGVGLRRRTGVD
jgi:hypothetical protein